MRSPAREAGIKILFEAPLAAYGLIEESLTRSMLGNLIKNAIEASAIKTEVTVRVLLHEDKIEITIHNPAEIPELIQDTFFEKYTTAKKSGGTGIGTYSAKLMAEVQKGGLRFTTSAREGTTLYIDLLIDTDAIQSEEGGGV